MRLPCARRWRSVDHELCGYDAVHLASASFWQDMVGERVTVATFDHQLWRAAHTAALGHLLVADALGLLELAPYFLRRRCRGG